MKTYILCPDIHINHHDPKFISLSIKIINFLKEFKTAPLNGFISLGDGLDLGQISVYDKNPAYKNTIADDIKIYNKIIDNWSDAMPRNSDMHFIQGNHELRLEKFLARNAKEYHEIVQPLQDLLKFPERNKLGKQRWHWHRYTNYKSLKIGDCWIMHGYLYGKNVCADIITKYKHSCITGHVHRVGMIREGNLYAATLGHGSLEEQTTHTGGPTNWGQALGVLTLLDDNTTDLEIIHVKEGKCHFRGKIIKG